MYSTTSSSNSTSIGHQMHPQDPSKQSSYIPSGSSTSLSSGSSSYSLIPPTLLTPPSTSLVSGYRSQTVFQNGQTTPTSTYSYINTPSTTPSTSNTHLYDPNQHFMYPSNNGMPGQFYHNYSDISGLNRSVSSASTSFIEVSRMVPTSVSPSGSLSDNTEILNHNQNEAQMYKHHHHHHHHHQTPCKSDYYINKKEKLIPTSTSKTNLYIRGLTEDTTDQDLHDMCQKYGEIKSTKAIIDKQTLKCKGYGFVDFKSLDDAKSALADLKKDQKDVQLAKQREQDPTNLYFANLPADIDEQCLANMLKNKFSANVNSTRIMRERSGGSKGVGFARIDDDKTCDNIISELNNKPFPEHNNKLKLILVKLADSGGILKPARHGQFRHGNNNSGDKDSLNNTLNSSSSTSALGVSCLNDSNNNSYSASNLNVNLNHQQQNQSYPHHQHHPQHYQAYMEPNYTGYPIIYDNYHSGATIISQAQQIAHPPPPPPLPHPHNHHHHQNIHHVPPHAFMNHHHHHQIQRHQIPHGHYVLPHGSQALAPYQVQPHYYPPGNGNPQAHMGGQVPYYVVQGSNYAYQQQAPQSKQLNETGSGANSATTTPGLNQQFSNMSLANQHHHHQMVVQQQQSINQTQGQQVNGAVEHQV